MEGRPAFLDTATAYGEDEGRLNPLLGRVLAETGAEVPILNKVGSGLLDGPDLGRRVVEDYQRGLADLGRSDAVLVHRAGPSWIDRDLALHDAVRASGRTRIFGICTNDPRILELYAGRMKIDLLQAAVNLLDAEAARPLLDLARRLDIPVLARSALASGLLGGAYGPQDVDRFTDDLRRRFGSSERNRGIFARRMEKVGLIRAYYERLRADGGYAGSFASFCYAAVRRLPGIDAVLLGGSREEQLRENLAWTAAGLSEETARDVAEHRLGEWAAPYL